MKKIVNENFNSISSGLLGALIGAIISGFITNYYAKLLWEDEQKFTIRNKQIELIKQTVQAISSSDEINMLIQDNNRLLKLLEVNRDYMDSVRHTVKGIDPQVSETNRQHYNRYFQNQRDIYKISGKYGAIIQQNVIFFDKKTNEIINNINHKYWWEEDQKKFQRLIDAMGEVILSKK
jgi:uncharacterized protein YoxC